MCSSVYSFIIKLSPSLWDWKLKQWDWKLKQWDWKLKQWDWKLKQWDWKLKQWDWKLKQWDSENLTVKNELFTNLINKTQGKISPHK